MSGAAAEHLCALPAAKSDSDKESKKAEENGFSLQWHYNTSQAESSIIFIFTIASVMCLTVGWICY